MAGQTGVVVTLDGEIHPPGTALLHADDLAAVRGDGVFETLLVREGGACLVESHLYRLKQSAKLMDLPEPDLPNWRRAIEVATRQWAEGTDDEGAMRLIYSRGRESGSAPTAYVMVNAVPEFTEHPKVIDGFTDLFVKETDDPDESGFGFELTFRLARDADDTKPPIWALTLVTVRPAPVSQRSTAPTATGSGPNRAIVWRALR